MYERNLILMSCAQYTFFTFNSLDSYDSNVHYLQCSISTNTLLGSMYNEFPIMHLVRLEVIGGKMAVSANDVYDSQIFFVVLHLLLLRSHHNTLQNISSLMDVPSRLYLLTSISKFLYCFLISQKQPAFQQYLISMSTIMLHMLPRVLSMLPRFLLFPSQYGCTLQ